MQAELRFLFPPQSQQPPFNGLEMGVGKLQAKPIIKQLEAGANLRIP